MWAGRPSNALWRPPPGGLCAIHQPNLLPRLATPAKLFAADYWITAEAVDGSDEATLWILADDQKSWASVDYVPGHDTFTVEHYGPRGLWDELESAFRLWEHRGRPDRDRAGLTITAEGQHVWLDTPDNIIN